MRSYQNAIVKIFIHILIISIGLFVSSCIYIKIGSGKGIIDGHFATVMKIVRAYVDAGFNVCTPPQLFFALNYNSGG